MGLDTEIFSRTTVYLFTTYTYMYLKCVVVFVAVMLSTYQPHNDMIESIVVCERNERMLVISASMDCSVQVWDIYGNHIGTFGQEEHWRIEPYVAPSSPELKEEQVMDKITS